MDAAVVIQVAHHFQARDNGFGHGQVDVGAGDVHITGGKAVSQQQGFKQGQIGFGICSGVIGQILMGTMVRPSHGPDAWPERRDRDRCFP